jgi:hypothetical protein
MEPEKVPFLLRLQILVKSCTSCFGKLSKLTSALSLSKGNTKKGTREGSFFTICQKRFSHKLYVLFFQMYIPL